MSNDLATLDESRQLQAMSQLPPDLMLLKMENESIMAVAKAKPREPMAIVQQLQELIDAYPAAADEAIYSKPVGTVIEVTCGDCGIKYEVSKVDGDTACTACESKRIRSQRKVKKFAEGLSIRAAESIRSIYGYTRLATTTELLDDGKARLTGVLVDYAAGNLTSDERIVSPFYRSRSGKMERVAEDRFLNLAVKAEKAKLRRDVILDSVPNIVKAMFRDACEKKLAALVAPEVVEQKIIPAFAEFGITPAHLDLIIGRPRALGWKEEDRLTCKKILRALKDGETNARELLDGLVDMRPQAAAIEPQSSKGTASGATIEDLTRPALPPEPALEMESPPPEPYPDLIHAIAELSDPSRSIPIRQRITNCGETGELSHLEVTALYDKLEARLKSLRRPRR